ncbi:MAG TPA: TMEM165/GDT1 family protein [Candidatus Limnocylindria bacterium]|nr:TMEM165/GDT1 family protein [Candidatus Limnocylindria bacterium]
MLSFLAAAGIAFGAVFVAEFGDKSQLLIFAFATRHPWRPVVAGLVLAAAVIQGISVAVGAVVGAALPTTAVGIVAGVAFLAVAAWTLRGGEEGETTGDGGAEGRVAAGLGGLGLVGTVAPTFIVGELGDKTMLATFALAASQGPIPTWIGTTAGEVAANLVAVVVGRQMGARLPERALRLGSAALFALAGILVLGGALLGSGE